MAKYRLEKMSIFRGIKPEKSMERNYAKVFKRQSLSKTDITPPFIVKYKRSFAIIGYLLSRA